MSKEKTVNLLPSTYLIPTGNINDIEALEAYYEGKLIKSEVLKPLNPSLYSFSQRISRYGNIDACILIVERDKDFLTKFFTYENEYIVIVSKDNKHLSCEVTRRKPRVGEIWVRGKELIKGVPSVDLYFKIAYTIVNYELKNLQIKT